MKLPNRTGTICRLSGKRRRPWMVRIYTPDGYAILGYYRLRSEATTALIEHAGKPLPPRSSPTVSLQDVWTEWLHRRQDLKPVNLQSYQNAWKRIQTIWDRPIRLLTVSDIENAVEASDPPPATREKIKSLLLQLYRYAIAHDMADKNIAEHIDIKKTPEKKLVRRPFSFAEVAELFQSSHPYHQMALVGIYTGMRPNEILSLCPAEVDLESQMFHIAGSKTKSGHFRHIPIHPAILSIITENIIKSAKFGATGLFYDKRGRQLDYLTYLAAMKEIGHTPHDTRHTFATYARTSGMDPLATKRILGHASKDITEDVYTHTDEAFLKREMRKYVVI